MDELARQRHARKNNVIVPRKYETKPETKTPKVQKVDPMQVDRFKTKTVTTVTSQDTMQDHALI